MSIHDRADIGEILANNSYPGRGIIVGKSIGGQFAVCAYFIMGRSVNSRNRIFVEGKDELKIVPFDDSKVDDPSLIIYYPVRKYKKSLIVTNGDQTDTIYDFLKEGKSFEKALETRRFEPDEPNFTPRISALLSMSKGVFEYKMSILKSADAAATGCNRFTYNYAPIRGMGHFIHTYNCDGTPIPSFTGEPERINIPDDIDAFANEIWDNLDEDNKVSLYVRYFNLADVSCQTRLFNKNHI